MTITIIFLIILFPVLVYLMFFDKTICVIHGTSKGKVYWNPFKKKVKEVPPTPKSNRSGRYKTRRRSRQKSDKRAKRKQNKYSHFKK